MLLEKSAEYWAREATIAELQDVVRGIDRWTDEEAAVLDFAYVERCTRELARTETGARDEALALADHLERVAHDSERAALDRLDKPYFARWRLLAEMMHRRALRLELPEGVLARKHVMEILLRVHDAGGLVAQADVGVIANEGQRSATLKLMEQWELIERRRVDGKAREVSITALGRLAIADRIAARTAVARTSTVKRGIYYLSSGSS